MEIAAPAKLILDFIRKTEVGDAGPAGYGVIFRHGQNTLSKPYTTMTVDEVIAAGSGWTKRLGSSASGGYQFMRDTLRGLKDELRLSGNEVMSPDFQDWLGLALLKRRGYNQFIARQMGVTDFARRLAQEWASFPVLTTTKGAHRTIARGETFYAGDHLNKALVKPEAIESLLSRALSGVSDPIDVGGPASAADAEGVDVRAIQLLLKNKGYDPGPIDGIMGPLTGAALVLFQRRNGLPESGVLDAATLDRLKTGGLPRVDSRRAQETEDDLGNRGSETIKLSKNSRLMSILAMVAAGLGWGGTQTNALTGLDKTLTSMTDGASSFFPLLLKLGLTTLGAGGGGIWVILFGLGFMLFRNGRAIAQRRVQDHQEGWNIKY